MAPPSAAGSASPAAQSIGYSPQGAWSFPDGTVFIKHFDMVVDETTGERRRLETRFLVRQKGGGVYGVSYRWRGEGHEADLVSTGQNDRIRVTAADGSVREQSWYFPSPMDCLVCHNTNAGDVLGVNARQLNRPATDAATGETDNQLRTWSRLGLFGAPLDDAAIAAAPALVPLDDPHASLEVRARSYLDANCAQCHRPNGAAGYFDARYDTPLAEQGLVDGRLAKIFGDERARVVCPGDLEHSALYQRMHVTGELQMPPLAKNVVDETATGVLGQWIQSLQPPTASAGGQ